MSDTGADAALVIERANGLEERNQRLRQRIVDAKVIGVNPGDGLDELIARLLLCAMPEHSGRVWFGHWQRISRAARALIEAYENDTPDWFPGAEIAALRDSLGCGPDKPSEVVELEAIVRALATVEPLVTKGETVHGEWEQCGICGAVNRWVGDTTKHDQACVWWDAAAWVLDHPAAGEETDG